jgi:hypothetical protein
MRKILLLCFLLAFGQVNGADLTALNRLLNEHVAFCKLDASKSECCPVCPLGPRGDDGKKGSRGSRGSRGPTGPSLEINDFIEVTTTLESDIAAGLISFTPISFPFTGIQAGVPGGLSLVESVVGSGAFNTITLPSEPVDTFYLVAYGFSISDDFSGDFQLVLNGVALPYTDLGIASGTATDLTLLDRTSIIVNPANTAGTLSVTTLSEVFLVPPLEGGFSGYMTVVKLSNFGS